MHDQCFITHLSTDLILYVIDFIPPESHFDFSITCKRMAECSSNILKRHREAYSKYRVASDISPVTIPTLLRSVFGRADPLFSWHVRSVEIWYDRTSWLDWKALDFEQPLHEADMEVDAEPWKWQDDEFSEYLEDIEGQFDAMVDNGNEEALREAREQFEDGLDGILKMLLIAYCPRLRDVKIITQEVDEKSTLGWLRRFIQGNILYGSHWPPGLCNIREIAVGAESDTCMSTRHEYNDIRVNMSMQTFSTLLRLPRLDSIYYNNLRRSGQDDQTNYISSTLTPPRSSTVKHIFLDDCSDMAHNFRTALFQAPLALETFTLRAGDCEDRMDDADLLVSGLATFQAASLHTLMFYGPYDHYHIHGYRCGVYRNEELDKARNLKTVAIDISDVELDCLYNTDGEDAKMNYEQQRQFFIKWFCESAFPSTLETLILWGQPYGWMSESKGHGLEWIEDALLAVIESNCYNEEETEEQPEMESEQQSEMESDDDDDDANGEVYLPNLKSIYLSDPESLRSGPSYRTYTGPRTDKLHFQKLIEAGRKTGVDVHTLTNRTPPTHSHNFPTAPDRYDLQTGPWWEQREEVQDWVFDVYKGRRRPRGCGSCGKCKACLEEYSEELWRGLDDGVVG